MRKALVMNNRQDTMNWYQTALDNAWNRNQNDYQRLLDDAKSQGFKIERNGNGKHRISEKTNYGDLFGGQFGDIFGNIFKGENK